MLHRREFLKRGALGYGLGFLLDRHVPGPGAPMPLSSPSITQSGRFDGSRAGQERVVEGIRVCWCPPGRFLMGTPSTEAGRRADEEQVAVTLTRGFWMAKLEVTQGDWARIIGRYRDRTPSERFGLGDTYPVYWVNFDDAEEYCRRMTVRARSWGSMPGDWSFAIPTEAQWEYACRAGTTTATAFGDRITIEQANFLADPARAISGESVGKASPVGSYPANPWGICDMHGNIFEWCRDWYHARLPGGTDPDLSAVPGVQNRDGTYSRVRRGGAWNDPAEGCRSGFRLRYEPHRDSDHIGFRVAIALG